MTHAEATALVATLSAAWPRQVIEQATLDIYAHDLADLEFGVAAKAVEAVRKTATFFPAIAEIRNAAAELLLQAPTPMVGYAQAVRQAFANPPPMHPLVSEAYGLVGSSWTWGRESEASLRKAFLAAYAEVRAEAIREITQPALGAGRKELAA